MSDAETLVSPLRNFDAWEKSLKNFAGWLGRAAPGAMDVDFLCEKGGQFLVIEAKPWQRGVSVPYGQHKALYALSLLREFRVYLAGEDDDVIHLARVDLSPKPSYDRRTKTCWWSPEVFIPSTKEQLASLVESWWKDADGRD